VSRKKDQDFQDFRIFRIIGLSEVSGIGTKNFICAEKFYVGKQRREGCTG